MNSKDGAQDASPRGIARTESGAQGRAGRRALGGLVEWGCCRSRPAVRSPSRSPGPARPAAPGRAAPIASAHGLRPRRTGALLHAVAHIEFNAINLALDALWRFPDLPAQYYRDWLRIAVEEALHFRLVCDHLRRLDCHDYGDHDAHDGLWAMAERTAGDFVARMALVPRTLEARGLDATPAIQARLASAGDSKAVEILDIILRDEIGHVAIGDVWYRWACALRRVHCLL
jgi:uncharacterized ferritin-like protein (DUF455 family)